MKQKIIRVLICAAVFVSSAVAEEPVEFEDANLKAAVEEALWVSDPTASDMLGLTYLYATSLGIRSLTGLEYAKNLQTLYVRWNELSSLSALSELTNLTYLDAHGNHNISDLSPLAGLTKLETLTLRINRISNISALVDLTHLKALDLRWNDISDISVLSGLTRLETCHLQWNDITDISALAQLTALVSLDLRGNPLNQEACDVYIPQIIANNPGIDIEYDACGVHELTLSSTLGGHVVQPGEGKFTYTNGEVAHLEAQADPGYVFVNWSGNYSDTSNPMFVSVRHSGTICANFASLSEDDPNDAETPDDPDPNDLPASEPRETVYVDDDAVDDPGPDDATWSDPLEDGTLEHPFDSIQEAIHAAGVESQILVHSGTYREQVDLCGKSLLVTGIDPHIEGYPVIDGNGVGPAVSFATGEDPNCTLAGFVVTGGLGDPAGAILCLDSSPTLANCLIVGNRWTDPNGAAICLTNSSTTLINCTIADNYGCVRGAGLCLTDSDVTVANSILWGNGTEEIGLKGSSTLAVSYSDVAGGWLGFGNTDADPLFARHGYWADSNDPNVGLDPCENDAVWIAGDYHPKSQAGRWDPQAQIWIRDEITSPCIDAGNPFDAVKHEPAPNANLINMGIYGGTAEASHSH